MTSRVGFKLVEFVFDWVALLPLASTEHSSRLVRRAATFLWLPWWLFLAAPVWLPLILVGMLIDMWENA